ncbi:hydroxyethylthiazole kinase [Oxalobacter aliiformigenes]|uniref:Hydroxyethylthiazole kinase n=1 Tax=Oxalobacter aliiformigenes TaxID=2946593 RepID=A0A9E9LDU7_9BURK|nr:hydroxyethylthiazole kinase [Oxalobacter aliiformigenes]WAV91137.1 hydroxyethylthiazole kinase [Oxalobacter aliiformigenes]
MTSPKTFAENLWNDVVQVRAKTPLIHNITNLVVMSYNANVLLALGATPVMAHAREEVAEMASIANALVLNIGTLQPEWIESMKLAAYAAHTRHIPVVLDPVGAGATTYRNKVIHELLLHAKPDIIRGNASEIMSVTGTAAPTRGVESTQPSGNAIHAARKLAKDIKGTVCVSGATDHIFDSTGREASLDNGHIWMTRITGAGCSASAMIGAFAAIQPDYWQAVTAAMAYMGIAGELAAETVISQNLGVGSMQTALLDKLQLMDKNEFLTRLKISSNA